MIFIKVGRNILCIILFVWLSVFQQDYSKKIMDNLREMFGRGSPWDKE